MKNLLRALGPLALDLVGTLLLAGLIVAGVPMWISISSAAGLQLAVIATTYARGHQIVALQWTSLVLILVAGTSSLIFRDARLIMLKPTIVYAAVGASMLQRGWMIRYVPPEARAHAQQATIMFGYSWAGLMFATAAINLGVVVSVPAYWAKFMLVFPIVTKIALFAVQYVATLWIVRRRVAFGTSRDVIVE
jgi:intracellular septation protein A